MNFKVFIETSVLVSASVFAISRELNVPLKHHFYDISFPLFDFLKDHVKQRLGVTTITVEEEARSVLMDAVLDEIEQEVSKNPERRELLFKLYSAFCDISFDNLSKNSSILLREPIPESEREIISFEVEELYSELSGFDIRKVAKELARFVPKRFKKMAENIYKEQLKHCLPLRRPPSSADKKILAEAVYLLRRYRKENPDFILYLASTDHHFSPSRDHKVKTASEKIFNKFGIVCDWPDYILEKVKKA